MTWSGPDDLLSAYFDHEVTAEERSAAEQLLEKSPEARQELEEIGGLSDLLKALPREEAPDFLLPAALQRAERETLLPEAAAPVAVASRPRRRREWLVVLAGLLTTSAAVLLMINALPRAAHGPADEFAAMATPMSAVADRTATTAWNFSDQEGVPLAAPADREREMVAREIASSRANGIPQQTSLAQRGVRGAGPATKSAPVLAAGQPVGGSPGTVGTAIVATDGPVDALGVLQRPEQEARDGLVMTGNSFRLGQVLPYLARNSDGDVTVIEFTVVDVDQAADSFEVLLSRNQVAQRQAGAEPKLAEAQPRRVKSGKDGLVAYYVQTDADLAGAVLQQLEAEPWVVKADLMPPVPGNELLPATEPVDARRVEEVLVRNGIEYGRPAEAGRAMTTSSPAVALGASVEAFDFSPERTRQSKATAPLPAASRSAIGGAGGQEQQIVQRLSLRPRLEVERVLNLQVAEAEKPATDQKAERSLDRGLVEKKLASTGNIRLLFILQQNEGLPAVRQR